MKKFLFTALFLVLCTTAFAFKQFASAAIPLGESSLEYNFFSCDFGNIAEIILIGDYAGDLARRNASLLLANPRIIANNTALSQDVKNKMKQLGANVCMTFFDNFVYVNILMSDGTYTTYVY
jgi:hypothetical protein